MVQLKRKMVKHDQHKVVKHHSQQHLEFSAEVAKRQVEFSAEVAKRQAEVAKRQGEATQAYVAVLEADRNAIASAVGDAVFDDEKRQVSGR